MTPESLIDESSSNDTYESIAALRFILVMIYPPTRGELTANCLRIGCLPPTPQVSASPLHRGAVPRRIVGLRLAALWRIIHGTIGRKLLDHHQEVLGR